MLQILPLKREHIQKIIAWNAGKDEEFLRQWSGPAWNYPITEEQYTERFDTQGAEHLLFEILLDGEMIGTIELLHIDPAAKTAFAGRFLLNPSFAGKGYGTKAFEKLLDFAFDELQLESVRLHVFAYNKIAVACYEKVGFYKVEEIIRPNGKLSYQMEIKKAIFKAKKQ